MIGFWDFKFSGAPPLLSFGVRILKMIQVTVLRLFLTLILFSGLVSASFAQDKILVEGKGFRDLLVGSGKVDDVIRTREAGLC
jgi:hypothetical protein